MTKALMILGHAHPKSLCLSLAHAFESGFRAEGGEVEVLDLTRLQFDPVFRGPDQEIEEPLQRAQASILNADHLVFAFPNYWQGAPAIVKAFIDRTFLPEFAYRHEGKPLPTGLLKGRSSRVIVTMDSPGWWYSLVLRRPIHASLGIGTLSYTGVSPRAYSTIYSVEHRSPEQLSRIVQKIEKTGKRDARAVAGRRRRVHEIGAVA